MKSKALALQEELSQVDTDWALLYTALKDYWGSKGPALVDVPLGTHTPYGMTQVAVRPATEAIGYLELVGQLNAFHHRLCALLGVSPTLPHYISATTMGHVTITEPILGGDAGITTTITYGPDTPPLWGGDVPRAYKLSMTLEDIRVSNHVSSTKELLTAIQRGYTCLRIMGRGTRYYHKGVGGS